MPRKQIIIHKQQLQPMLLRLQLTRGHRQVRASVMVKDATVTGRKSRMRG